LDFAVNRFLMKLFRSNNIKIIAECRRYFQFNLPSELIEKTKTKFEENYSRCVLVLRDICVRAVLGKILFESILSISTSTGTQKVIKILFKILFCKSI